MSEFHRILKDFLLTLLIMPVLKNYNTENLYTWFYNLYTTNYALTAR